MGHKNTPLTARPPGSATPTPAAPTTPPRANEMR